MEKDAYKGKGELMVPTKDGVLILIKADYESALGILYWKPWKPNTQNALLSHNETTSRRDPYRVDRFGLQVAVKKFSEDKTERSIRRMRDLRNESLLENMLEEAYVAAYLGQHLDRKIFGIDLRVEIPLAVFVPYNSSSLEPVTIFQLITDEVLASAGRQFKPGTHENTMYNNIKLELSKEIRLKHPNITPGEFEIMVTKNGERRTVWLVDFQDWHIN